MAHFYGRLKGTRGEATRCGTASAGLTTICASWNGAVECNAYTKDGIDYVQVQLREWHGKGMHHILYDGPINGAPKGRKKHVTC